ncbi:MAG: NAD(P)-dependent oxidoreductase [Bacteroidetes bacterium 47-18]|nr:MAG: NAD(P)-dependent oxidoreductase [Bacteroidetes bacterium 47-18]
MQTVLITGASSGIGKATVTLLAASGYNLVICGRNTDALSALQQLYPGNISHILQFDISKKDEVFSSIQSLGDLRIDILINNAGNAHGLATFDQADITDLEAMIDINVKGLIYVSKAVLPLMIPYGSGHIVNISSIAGKQVYLNGTTYCASKFAVEALTQGMRIDLLPHNIKVTGIAPGAVATNFSLVRFKGDQSRADAVYEGYTPLSAEDVANTILFAIRQPEHVQIADLTVLPSVQASAVHISRKV